MKIPKIVHSARKSFLMVWSSTPGKVGILITSAILFIAIFAPFIAPYSPNQPNVGPHYGGISAKHLLGTDDIGEDIFSQLLWASRGSIFVGFFAGGISILLGVVIGLFSGYFGGRTDEALMRTTDVVLVLPLLPLLIVIASLFPASVFLVILVIGLLSWPVTARVIRSQTLTLKSRPFVDALKLSGMNDLEIMFKVLLPNQLSLILSYGVFAAVTAVVIEAGLDFIGLGSINNLSWGIMLYFALSRDALLRGMWWWFLPPGLMIAVFGTGLILLGYGAERAGRISPR
jgi:peptide/nickel transport system permease protein